MAYGDFTLAELKSNFQLTIDEQANLFTDTPEPDLPVELVNMLSRYLPLAVNVNIEKARSELLIAPVSIEFKLLHHNRVRWYSAVPRRDGGRAEI
jgi:hypothetical protein